MPKEIYTEVIMKRVELTQEQCLYLQFILNYFRAESHWPTYRQLDHFFNQTHPDIDIEDIWKSLPTGLTSYLDINLLDELARLTLAGIYALEPNAPEFELFLQIVKLCVKTYFASENDPIRSEDILLSDPTWNEAKIAMVGWLLLGEPNIWRSFGGPDPQSGSWNCTLERRIRRFRDITTMDDYWEKRNLPRPQTPISLLPSDVSVPIISDTHISTDISVPLHQLELHPDIHTKCWNFYTQGDYDNAIFTATRAIEVAVRRKAQLPDDLVGANLIVQAFKIDSPILTYSTVKAEQEGMMALLRGIIQVYKNPQSHRHVGVQNQSECLGVILMCSNLLYTIDKL